jgi:glycosyltransferase involved in cell wall biosynthesis
MVSKAVSVLGGLTDDYEVLIVDDGSTDGSKDIAHVLAAHDAHVRVIHHSTNRGYGAALRTGLKGASKDLVFYTDCDEPIDLAEIRPALARLGPDVDLVIGYRIDRHDTPRRWLFSLVYNGLVRLLFDVHVRDVNFSFKLIRKTVLQGLDLRASSTFIDGELLAEAVRYGYCIVEMPIKYYPRKYGKSSFGSLGAALEALEEMIAYFWRSRFSRSSTRRDQPLRLKGEGE